ncbi:MAG: hypothetical protein K6A96_15305 [Prevotella sp.]|nr:hypothetical protein [Prevotella sp.]
MILISKHKVVNPNIDDNYMEKKSGQHEVHHCLLLYKLEKTDPDELIEKKFNDFKIESKAYPTISLGFVNHKKEEQFVSVDGEIQSVPYEAEEEKLSSDDIAEMVLKEPDPKNQWSLYCFLNTHLGEKSVWRKIAGALKKKIMNNIERENLPHFPMHALGKDKGVELWGILTNNDVFISSRNSNLDSFLFILGFVGSKPVEFRPIQWVCNKELLRVLLFDYLYKKDVDEKVYKQSELLKMVPGCFVDKNGNGFELPKAKSISNTLSDRLHELMRQYFDR